MQQFIQQSSHIVHFSLTLIIIPVSNLTSFKFPNNQAFPTSPIKNTANSKDPKKLTVYLINITCQAKQSLIHKITNSNTISML